MQCDNSLHRATVLLAACAGAIPRDIEDMCIDALGNAYAFEAGRGFGTHSSLTEFIERVNLFATGWAGNAIGKRLGLPPLPTYPDPRSAEDREYLDQIGHLLNRVISARFDHAGRGAGA